MADELKSFESLIKEWANGGFPSLSPEQVVEIYAVAFGHYASRRYGEAENYFRLLTVISPLDHQYWKGLGASLQMQGKYSEAINGFVCSQILNKDMPDPYLYVYAADCYFALGHVELGLKALNAAQLSAEEVENENVLHHVSLMRDLWSNKDKKGY